MVRGLCHRHNVIYLLLHGKGGIVPLETAEFFVYCVEEMPGELTEVIVVNRLILFPIDFAVV